jgi:hypothetical protein
MARGGQWGASQKTCAAAAIVRLTSPAVFPHNFVKRGRQCRPGEVLHSMSGVNGAVQRHPLLPEPPARRCRAMSPAIAARRHKLRAASRSLLSPAHALDREFPTAAGNGRGRSACPWLAHARMRLPAGLRRTWNHREDTATMGCNASQASVSTAAILTGHGAAALDAAREHTAKSAGGKDDRYR